MSATNVCIDLGSDSLKVSIGRKAARSYEFEALKGNLVGDTSAIVFYDETKRQWILGADINKQRNESFLTIVKITHLLKMTSRAVGGKVTDADIYKTIQKNIDYFENKYLFPIYFFINEPKAIRDNPDDFEARVKNSGTFTANMTPKEVCVMYFTYVLNEIKNSLYDKNINDFSLTVLFHYGYGKSYKTELMDIIHAALTNTGLSETTVSFVNSVQAISYYVRDRGLISEGEKYLIFDIGEEYISACKGSVLNLNGQEEIITEHPSLHSLPLRLGGLDIDKKITEVVIEKTVNHETIGSESTGHEEHMIEQIRHAKEYLLMKNIKAAKELLSSEDRSIQIAFHKGAPVSYYTDACIQCYVTPEDIHTALFAGKENSIFERFVNYILGELRNINCRDVTKLILTGGASQTFGLADKIRERIEKEFRSIRFIYMPLFSRPTLPNLCLYSAALGGNIIGAAHIDIKATAAFTYGSYLKFKGTLYFGGRGSQVEGENETKCFVPMIYRNDALPWNSDIFMPDKARLKFNGNGECKDYFYQINLGKAELSHLPYDKNYHLYFYKEKKGVTENVYLDIDDANLTWGSPLEKARKEAGLRVVSNGAIVAYYKDQRVRAVLDSFADVDVIRVEDKIPYNKQNDALIMKEGIHFNDDWDAIPAFENVSDSKAKGKVVLYGDNPNAKVFKIVNDVYLKDIVIKWKEDKSIRADIIV